MKSYQQSYTKKFFDDAFYLFLALLINLSILYLDKIIGTDLFAVYLKWNHFMESLCSVGIINYLRKKCTGLWISTEVLLSFVTNLLAKEIKRNLHLSDNANLNIDDKLLKVRPYMDLLKKISAVWYI